MTQPAGPVDAGPRPTPVVLISTYELGHQPFGLASPAAWLRRAGAYVTCNDLAVDTLDEPAVRAAGMIAVYTPMHTATRLSLTLLPRLRDLNPDAEVCCYGLYAPMNQALLRARGANHLIGGEFEPGLVALYRQIAQGDAPAPRSGVQLSKQSFVTPDREDLPALGRYAYMVMPDGGRRIAGYTEATRGCKHLCRHCPVVPVYNGRFFVVQRDVVLDDIAAQVAAGAQHISFGDPDFFNGPGHALPLVAALHEAFPDLTYDVTIKVSHLLRHHDLLADLARTGCMFVTTAVESVDDRILGYFDKGHSRADFVRAIELTRAVGLAISPTFIPFTPWTTVDGYIDLLRVIDELDLVAHVAPVQLGIRLLVPPGSLLLKLPELAPFLGAADPDGLGYQWHYADDRMAALEAAVCELVSDEHAARDDTFAALWRVAHTAGDSDPPPLANLKSGGARAIPRMSEPWYCCAEPTTIQRERV